MNAACVHHYLSVFMCFENTNHSHLLSVMHGGIMMPGPQTGNNLSFFSPVCVCVCVSLSLCVAGLVCLCV